MSYYLSAPSLRRAVKHICRYGDTDVLPHLAEIAFLRERENEIVNELKKLDLDMYSPSGAVEALTPKSRYGFRIVHQLSVLPIGSNWITKVVCFDRTVHTKIG
jgi:hypothetical protein